MMMHVDDNALALTLCLAIDKLAEIRQEDIGAMEILQALEIIRHDLTEALIDGRRKTAL